MYRSSLPPREGEHEVLQQLVEGEEVGVAAAVLQGARNTVVVKCVRNIYDTL